MQTLFMKQDGPDAHQLHPWAGIGSAVLNLWQQKFGHASVSDRATVSDGPSVSRIFAFLYLGSVLVLHITTPALFSAEMFNSTSVSVVPTEGLPTMDILGYNKTTTANLLDVPVHVQVTVKSYIEGSLKYLPYVEGSRHIGLMGGTLYDVPSKTAAVGNINVSATVFNISYGFLQDVEAIFSANTSSWELRSRGTVFGGIDPTGPGVISTANPSVFYSTVPLVNSANNTGGFVNLTPPMNTTVSSIQVFRCFLSLVKQNALVDAQSRQPVALYSEPIKTTSTWHPAALEETPLTTGNPLVDLWGVWYNWAGISDFPRSPDGQSYLSIPDMYLVQKLNLHSANESRVPTVLTLHDFENTLAELVANMFWTIGHIPPTHQLNITNLNITDPLADPVGGPQISLIEIESLINLLPGENTTATNKP
ncbi:hypothetical protein C8R44DRAFT_887162 [Mycena epipterygia]|nr:hypothetical protein C8R44DRAFT_887162 [Mycena epipterygia]